MAKKTTTKTAAKPTTPQFTVPGMSADDAGEVIRLLQNRLDALNDLQLTLKHVHWNVVGPYFIGVHEMLDPQVDAVRLMVDATAERIATLGGSPQGTPGGIVARRSWDDYDLGRAGVPEHLGALDMVYASVITFHREAQGKLEDLDPVTEDMIIDQLQELELFHWFVRAHLETPSGQLSTVNESTEKGAARKAGATARRTA